MITLALVFLLVTTATESVTLGAVAALGGWFLTVLGRAYLIARRAHP
jgi:hypothetical protein